jgi:hypothetical protein
MTAQEALQRIIDEAERYAANPARFRPKPGDLSALENIHLYREGVRDGKLQAARVAREGLESARKLR